MEISISVEGLCGLTWPRWQRLVSEIERMGFGGLFCSDHFILPDLPAVDSLELIVSLTYLAHQSSRVHFGSLVAPMSFRDPVMLARQAMALDDLSGGRMILGVGAGWMESEHSMFGYDLADVRTRMDRFEEGLEVITRLSRDDEPVTFAGRFFRLQEAQLLPRPRRRTPILIGGNGPKRTLPLVARYADIWNCQPAPPELFKERSALLDELLRARGRQPGDVKRTMLLSVLCWRDQNDLERRMNLIRGSLPSMAALTTEQVLGFMSTALGTLAGTPKSIGEQLMAYANAGVEELMIQWISLDDIEGLKVIAEDLLPQFR
jgi:alkanesulfonate monooxygenase SsuD/methylene tetrahydromethanopterin reductase-like flavin-dependent oxidoreductase (luciferase family)